MAASGEENDRLRRVLLLHLLEHHGQQVRFEASPWTTEFGILRRFPEEDPTALRGAIRALEMARLVFQRTQYVVGYSEPKTIYSLTASGHRLAIAYRDDTDGAPVPPPPSPTPSPIAADDPSRLGARAPSRG